jgi:DNA repair protein RadC
MAITDWPANERPRENCVCAAEALSDAELLAIFLRTGRRGTTAVDLARELLAHFGILRALLVAGREEFCATPGSGLAINLDWARSRLTRHEITYGFQVPIDRKTFLDEPQ